MLLCIRLCFATNSFMCYYFGFNAWFGVVACGFSWWDFLLVCVMFVYLLFGFIRGY